MRIITGSAKNTVLKTPKSQKVIRPALAQVREAIFSSLGNIEDYHFVDLFGGTGSLGLEALSRGAEFCTFVDIHPEALKLISQNILACGFKDQTSVQKIKLPHGLKRLKLQKVPDVLFCDPPYDKGLLNPTLENALKYNVIDAQTLVIIEHTAREVPEVKGLTLEKQKRFGQTYISYLKRS